ncbi:hypothetical protein J4G08_12685 [Candidatus Poribacteria bacterium]|nr:hypothetical protein [Candidatus Poribacteria bacterium]
MRFGRFIAFNFCGEDFPTEPKTAFYDWLYITALYQKKKDLMEELEKFQGFSDIVFNPSRSLNCQARAICFIIQIGFHSLFCFMSDFLFIPFYPTDSGY